MFGMFRNVFDNLFLKFVIRFYLKEKRLFFKDIRGSFEIEIEKCIFCGIC